MSKEKANVAKIAIYSYSDKKMTHKEKEQFSIPISPENFAQQYKVALEHAQGAGQSKNSPKYKFTPSNKLDLEFMLDNTGTVMGNILDGTPIMEQLNTFLKTTYNTHSKTHEPRYVKIIWGGADAHFTRDDGKHSGGKPVKHKSGTTMEDVFVFKGRLDSVDVRYVLFKPTGEPLRAKVKASFVEYVEPEAAAKMANHQSPDVTHVRTAKDSDRLPLMTYEMYSDQQYYMKVAKANNLTSFRKLNAGDEIFFPPIVNDPIL